MKIKIRAWDPKTEYMFYKEKNGHGISLIDFSQNRVWLNGLIKRITECKIMLYIGRKDKNDNDIYEGDILKYGDKIGVVKYDNCGFHLTNNKFNIHLSVCNNVEIIGNIYEEPLQLRKRSETFI